MYAYINTTQNNKIITVSPVSDMSDLLTTGVITVEFDEEIINSMNSHQYLVYANDEVTIASYTPEEVERLITERKAPFLYKQDRKMAYPDIGEQLDALFHAGVFPDEMAAKIQAVKDAHPKPTE